jgi:hypothetical protein
VIEVKIPSKSPFVDEVLAILVYRIRNVMTAIIIDSEVNISTQVFNVPIELFSGVKVTKYSIINKDPTIPASRIGILDFIISDIFSSP